MIYVARRPFIRDIVAFLIAIILINCILVRGEHNTAYGVLLVSYYFAYVIVVVFGSWIFKYRFWTTHLPISPTLPELPSTFQELI